MIDFHPYLGIIATLAILIVDCLILRFNHHLDQNMAFSLQVQSFRGNLRSFHSTSFQKLLSMWLLEAFFNRLHPTLGLSREDF